MYTIEIVQAIEDSLLKEDRAMVDAQVQFYAEYYERISEVYERVYGIPLAKLDSYSPIRRIMEDGTMDEFMGGVNYQGSVAGASLKSRKDSIREVQNSSDLKTMVTHIAEMEYFIAMAEKVQLLDGVFNDETLARNVKAVNGDVIWNELKKELDHFANRNQEVQQLNSGVYNTLIRNFGFAQLALKPQIGLKQLASLVAYAEGVNTIDFMAGLAIFLSNPPKAIAFMNKGSKLFKNRGFNIDRDYAAVLNDDSKLNFVGKRPKLAKLLMTNIKWGDKGAIGIGGFAYMHARMKAGATKAQAFEEFGRITVATQQSQDVDQLSNLQRSNNPMWRLLVQFRSSASALNRAEMRAILDVSQGRLTTKQFAKRIFIYHIAVPNLIQIIANGFEFDEEDHLRASLLGSFNGMYIVGELIESLVTMLTSGVDSVYDLQGKHPLQAAGDIMVAVGEFASDPDLDLEDILEGVRTMDGLTKAISAGTGGV